MKDKIKKFFKDHEDEMNIVMTISGIIAAGAGIHMLYKGNGHHVTGVFSGDDVPGGSTVFVTLKNGYVLPYTKPEV